MLRLKQRFSGVRARFMHTPVAKCYDGQSIFITGATGFLGKVLLEKLLYSCSGINKVYLLVREDRENNAHQRVHKILEQPLFNRLRSNYTQAIQKIVPIAGDVSKPELGIKNEDIQMLQEKVSIVFHSAATVKFNEPLDVSTNVNINGTQRVLDLCHNMKNIKAFIHVSTAFVNRHKDVLEEKLNDPPIPVTRLQEMVKSEITEEQVQALLKGRPNTYTLTKAVAENCVADRHGNIPTAIIRPSAITCSISEPMTGWLDNWFVLNAILMMIGKGWARCLMSKPENVYDFIPVDYVANLMIVAAVRCNGKNDVEVFNCTSSAENPLTCQVFVDSIIQHSLEHKLYDYPPHVYITSSKIKISLLKFLLETIPANLADAYFTITLRGKKARYRKIQYKINLIRAFLDYFSKHSWSIPASKTIALAKTLSPVDRETFPFDPRTIKWDEYMKIYCDGVRKYLLGK